MDSKDANEAQDPDKLEDRGRAHVKSYGTAVVTQFPLERGETVWIWKDAWRAPLGEFVIERSHPNDLWELKKKSDNTIYGELVEGKYLVRDPYTVNV